MWPLGPRSRGPRSVWPWRDPAHGSRELLLKEIPQTFPPCSPRSSRHSQVVPDPRPQVRAPDAALSCPSGPEPQAAAELRGLQVLGFLKGGFFLGTTRLREPADAVACARESRPPARLGRSPGEGPEPPASDPGPMGMWGSAHRTSSARSCPGGGGVSPRAPGGHLRGRGPPLSGDDVRSRCLLSFVSFFFFSSFFGVRRVIIRCLVLGVKSHGRKRRAAGGRFRRTRVISHPLPEGGKARPRSGRGLCHPETRRPGAGRPCRPPAPAPGPPARRAEENI